MEIQGNSYGSSAAALSALSPGQKQLPLVQGESDELRKRQDERGARVALESSIKAKQAEEAKKPAMTYEDRLKLMISADELRRLLFLYSPFTRGLVTQEKGLRLNRTA